MMGGAGAGGFFHCLITATGRKRQGLISFRHRQDIAKTSFDILKILKYLSLDIARMLHGGGQCDEIHNTYKGRKM